MTVLADRLQGQSAPSSVWSAGLILFALSLRRSRLHDDDVPDDLAAVELVEGRVDLLERPRA